MAFKKATKSVDTGLYWPCSAGVVAHPRMRIAWAVQKGPKAFHVRCMLPKCGSMTFLGKGWQDNYGMTEAQARAQGYTIIDDGA